MTQLTLKYEDEVCTCEFQESQTVHDVIAQKFIPRHAHLQVEELFFYEKLDDIEIPMVLDDFLYFLEEPLLVIRQKQSDSEEPSVTMQSDSQTAAQPDEESSQSIELAPICQSRSEAQEREPPVRLNFSRLGRLEASKTQVAQVGSEQPKAMKIVEGIRKQKGFFGSKSSIMSAFTSSAEALRNLTFFTIQETQPQWFPEPFSDTGRLALAERPLLTDYESIPVYGGVPGRVKRMQFEPGDEEVFEFIVGRNQAGGWVFACGVKDNAAFDAILPVCTTYEIAIYQKETIIDVPFPDDFLQPEYEGDSDKELETFVLRVESLFIVVNASISAISNLNKALAIAYSEIVGSFSPELASSKEYGELAASRVQSCKLAMSLRDKLDYEVVFGLEINQDIITEFFDYDDIELDNVLFEFAIDLLQAGCENDFDNVVFTVINEELSAEKDDNKRKLEHEEKIHQLEQEDTDEAKLELEELKEIKIEYTLPQTQRVTHRILEKLLQYPSYNKFQAFSELSDELLKYRGQMTQINFFGSNEPVELPVVLESLVNDELREGTVPDGAPERYAINCCIFGFDQIGNVEAEESIIIPYSSLFKYEESKIDFDSSEYLLFEEFLPAYINNADEDYENFPEQYKQIIVAFRALKEQSNSELELFKTFACLRNGYPTVIIAGFEPCDECSTPLKGFLSNLKENYGDCAELDELQNYFNICTQINQQLTGKQLILLSFTHKMFTEQEVLIDAETGLPPIADCSNGINEAERQIENLIQSPLVVHESEFAYEEFEFKICTPVNYEPISYLKYANISEIAILLLRKTNLNEYSILGQLFYDFGYVKYNVCDGNEYDFYDQMETDDGCNYEKSISDKDNNVHPFRGPVDEYALDNEEFNEAMQNVLVLRKSEQELANEKEFLYQAQKESILLQYCGLCSGCDVEQLEFVPYAFDLDANMPDFEGVCCEELIWKYETPLKIDKLSNGMSVKVGEQIILDVDGSVFSYICPEYCKDYVVEPEFDAEEVKNDSVVIEELTSLILQQTWLSYYENLRVPASPDVPALAAEKVAYEALTGYVYTPHGEVQAISRSYYNEPILQCIEHWEQLLEVNQEVVYGLAACAEVVPAPVQEVKLESIEQQIARAKREYGIDEQLRRILNE